MGLFGKKKKDNGLIKKYELINLEGIGNTIEKDCDVDLFNNKLIIGNTQKTYTLKIDSIKSISLEKENRVETTQKSSLTKGIVGGALFGVPGAIVGSAPKEKSKKFSRYKLSINYISSEGKNKTIILSDSYENFNNVFWLNDKLKNMIQTEDKIKNENIDL